MSHESEPSGSSGKGAGVGSLERVNASSKTLILASSSVMFHAELLGTWSATRSALCVLYVLENEDFYAEP